MALAVCQIPFMAAETSMLAAVNGVPFGGTIAWTLAFVTTNDSEDAPYTPVVAAVVGWPVTLVSDVVLFVPCIVVWAVVYFRKV